jgi:hypothetical protein
MKTLFIFILLLVGLSGFSQTNSSSSFPSSGGGIQALDSTTQINNISLDTTVQYLLTLKSNGTIGKALTTSTTGDRVLVSISSAHILAGDSISVLAAPGTGYTNIIISISGLFTAGTKYTKIGTDTTWLYSYNGSVKTKLTFLLDTFLLSTSTVVAYAPILSPNVSLNKPIWFKIATGFAGGTGTLKLVLYYKRENFN